MQGFKADDIYPVILSGGAGTRLWPVSRKSFPKQFQFLGAQGAGAQTTLFQNTLMRVQGSGFAPPTIMTGEDFRFIVKDQIGAVPTPPRALLIEPDGRNTGPAVLAAALNLAVDHPQALMLVLPSDHAIPDAAAFQRMVRAAVPAALDGQIITFGVTPLRAETGYGYLELDGAAGPTPAPLRCFVEKPDAMRAAEFLSSGRHLWNAGIFLARVDVWRAAFHAHAPEMVNPVQASLAQAKDDLGFLRLAPGPWAKVPDISLDYAVMEQAGNVSVQAFDGAWSDLGSWDAIWRDTPQDARAVALAGAGGAEAIDCDDTLIYKTEDAPAVVGLGLSDVVVVATADAVLVADKSRTQDVKLAVDQMTQKGQGSADQTLRCHRPWGWYETLALGGRFQVKRIVVKPGGSLSLQSHHHRSEHWVVVEGTAKITVQDQINLVSENQSVYVPLGAQHRLENPGVLPMVLIEIQTGAYLGEDDIIRYEDAYNRPTPDVAGPAGVPGDIVPWPQTAQK